ncbi:MAG: MBL fold metallo-hydrolase [Phycisphaerae bacterium]|nr:MBL fold metallo-hydrolase [Phycisphaerae bacterium]
MLLRMIYDPGLAQAAYLIGCQRTKEAIVFDPERDIDRYMKAAESNGVKIIAVAETHIHADFLSGARELAEKVGARVYVSDEGDSDWKYQWLDKRSTGGSYDHRLLKNGDVFRVGNIEFKAVHTPGHTPEHMMFVVTDLGAGATEPIGAITGDFVFVGDLGRPDLLETAAGVEGAKEPSARRLFSSLPLFLNLPDFVQVWPAHGAGSACGKALGAVPQTTVGYERRFSPALRAATSEKSFVDFILEGQPEPPTYFARMKRENKMGPRILGSLPKPIPLTAEEALRLDPRSSVIIDTRQWDMFQAGHIPGSLFAPKDSMFSAVVGSYVGENEGVYLVVETSCTEDAVRELVRIGLDNIVGMIDRFTIDKWAQMTGKGAKIAEVDALKGADMLDRREAVMLDVRRHDEFVEGHASGAIHVAHTRLSAELDRLPRDTPLLVTCRSGGRSSRASAYLQRKGFKVTNLAGGMLAWERAGNVMKK